MGSTLAQDSSQMPFWAYTGQYGLVPHESAVIGRAGARTEFDESRTFQWKWGVSLQESLSRVADDKDPASMTLGSSFIPDEAYASLRLKPFSLDLGIKHREMDFLSSDAALGSLSVTGGHLVESGNTRSMPGWRINLEPLTVPRTKDRIQIYGTFGDYFTLDKRYVRDALVHRMTAGIRAGITDRLDFDFVVDHYALWGGVHPVSGTEGAKVTLGNYLRVIFAAHAGGDGTISDQINVIGDHGGAELFKLTYKADDWTLTAQHDIPYSDGSGMMFQNFPDGVNTLALSLKDRDAWITDVLFEHQYTMWQSGAFHDVEDTPENRKKYHYKSVRDGRLIIGGRDNYFNNGFYRSGWTYFGQTIGNPLFTPVKNGYGIENNRVKACHFGLSGKLFHKSPYKLMVTWSQNFGRYAAPYMQVRNQLSAGLSGLCPVYEGKMGNISLSYGIFADRGDHLGNNTALTFGIRYTL